MVAFLFATWLLSRSEAAAITKETILDTSGRLFWVVGVQCSTCFVILLVYFTGRRLGICECFRSFRTAFEMEKLKLRQNRFVLPVKECESDDDDVSTRADGSELSGSSSSDDEEGAISAFRVGVAHRRKLGAPSYASSACMIARTDLLRMRSPICIPSAGHLHARVFLSTENSTKIPTFQSLSTADGRWDTFPCEERDWSSLRKVSSKLLAQNIQSVANPECTRGETTPFVLFRPPPGLSLFEETLQPGAVCSQFGSINYDDQWQRESEPTTKASKKGSLTGALSDITLGRSLRPSSLLGSWHPGSAFKDSLSEKSKVSHPWRVRSSKH